jgi:hypothetical protein
LIGIHVKLSSAPRIAGFSRFRGRFSRILLLKDCGLPAWGAISEPNFGLLPGRRARAEIFGNIAAPQETYLDAMALAVYHRTPKLR